MRNMVGNVSALAPVAESLVGLPAVLTAASVKNAAIVGKSQGGERG